VSTIPVFDYLAQYERLKDEIDEAIRRVLESGQLILGPEGERFEAEFADYLGGGGSCVGVGNGTDALAIALRALDVGPDDEVVTVANTAIPTVGAIREAGARPVFCDVEPDTALMDLAQLGRCISSKTRVILPVHLYGNVVDVSRIRSLIDGRPIRVLEDCAQAHGATLDGKMAGTLGDVSAFSFYPTKNLGAYGDAGICHAFDDALVEKMRQLRSHGCSTRYSAEREGVNSRLDELQAAILGVKLRHLPGFSSRRRALAARYDARLQAKIERFSTRPEVVHARHLYVVKVTDRVRVREHLAEEGVATSVHYPHPIHLMRAYTFLGYEPGSLPVTEALSEEVLSLPLYPELDEASVDRVCEALMRTAEG
jgi:dTDP-4-amino-4,6-dideoxygalactose transaminase